MLSETFYSAYVSLQPFASNLSYENFTTGVMFAYIIVTCGACLCIGLFPLCCIKERIIPRIECSLKSALMHIKTNVSRMPFWLLLFINRFFKVALHSSFVCFFMFSLYCSTFDDVKASIIPFIGVALTVWITKYYFSCIRSLNNPFLSIMGFVSYFLVLSGFLCLMCKFWTTGCYLACLGKIIEKNLSNTRYSLMVSSAYLHMEGESSEMTAVETFKYLEMHKVSEYENDQHVFLASSEEMNQLELHNFSKLEDCNRVNAVINHYFEIFAKNQEVAHETKMPVQMGNDVSDNTCGLKEIINEFAQTLEATERPVNKDPLVHCEISLEDCNEVNLLVNEFIRSILLIHRRENCHYTGKQMKIRNGRKNNLLLSEYVQLINRFVRKLSLIRELKNTNLVNKSEVCESDETSKIFQRVEGNGQPNENYTQLTVIHSEVSNEIQVEKRFEAYGTESLDNIENNESADGNGDGKNESSVIAKKDILDDCAMSKPSDFTSDKSQDNEHVCKMNSEVMESDESYKILNEPVVETSICSREMTLEQFSSEMYKEDQQGDDSFKSQNGSPGSQQRSTYPSEINITEVPVHDETKLVDVEPVKGDTSVISDENCNSPDVQVNICGGNCEFQSVETHTKIYQKRTSTHLLGDMESLTEVKNLPNEQTEVLFRDSTQKNLTSEESMGDSKMAICHDSISNPYENMPHSTSYLHREIPQVHGNIGMTSPIEKPEENESIDSFSKRRQDSHYEETGANNLKVRDLVALLESRKGNQNVKVSHPKRLISSQINCLKSLKNGWKKSESNEHFIETPSFKEISSLNSFDPTISFSSHEDIGSVRKLSSKTDFEKDLSMDGHETVIPKTEVPTGCDVRGSKSRTSAALSCVEDVVNRIDVRFIYGLQ